MLCFVIDHWQQFHVANKDFTAAILSLNIFFYSTFDKVKMTHSLLDSMLPKMHTFNTQPKNVVVYSKRKLNSETLWISYCLLYAGRTET